jgi:hypothetical protein
MYKISLNSKIHTVSFGFRRHSCSFAHWLCLFIGCIFLHTAAFAQRNAFRDNWYKGSLILSSGDTLSGLIHFELNNDLVQINLNETVKTYSARQIWSYQIYDPDMMADRHFYALEYQVEPNYKIPVLFEVLVVGDVSLLAREKLVTESVPQYDYWGNGRYLYTRNRLSHDLYFGFANGKIRKYGGTKKDFFYLIKDRSGEMKKFIKENRLRYNDVFDMVQIIDYYNSLKSNTKQ